MKAELSKSRHLVSSSQLLMTASHMSFRPDEPSDDLDADVDEMQQIVDTTVYSWARVHGRTNDWVWKSDEAWYVQEGWQHA